MPKMLLVDIAASKAVAPPVTSIASSTSTANEHDWSSDWDPNPYGSAEYRLSAAKAVSHQVAGR